MRRRRFEILLPLKDNDGRPASGELFEQVRELLVNRFKGLTFWPQSLLGTWLHKGTRYEEELVMVVVDVADSKANRQFFRKLKLTLRERFKQIEIYIASYVVDVL